MSEQEQLPACALCGHEPAWTPAVPERLVCCTHSGCMCAGWDMPETMWRRLMAPPYEAIDGSDVVTIAVPASIIPAGATLRECYETDSEVIVIGAPDPDDENHNCDAMGCGSCGHVLYRFPKSRPRLAPEHVERLRSFADWLDAGFGRDDDGPDLSTDASAIRAALAALGEAGHGISSADRIERERGLEALRESQKAHAAGKLMVVHYKCDRLDADPCRVRGIAVKSLASGLLEYFPGVEAEKEGIAGFGKYLAEHPGSVWLCWNMKDEVYGFPHLSARSVTCGLGPLPQVSCVDLALVYWRLHGSIKAEGGEKMLALAEVNGLSTHGALPWQKMEPSHSGRAIALDARRRVEIIHGLWVRLAAGTLVVPKEV